MTERLCSIEGCTYADTGVCLQNVEPPDTCPNLSLLSEPQKGTQDRGEESRVTDRHSFPSGQVLDLTQVSELASDHYTQIVGVLGAPNAGKTAMLVSLYLMVSNAKLDGFSFRDSNTLIAFEDISRGARRWNNGAQPEELTTHTRGLDDRRPGFVHIRLERLVDGHMVSLALPDLPGEWTTSLVESNNFGRLDFLNACEVIWVVIDGKDARDPVGLRRERNRTELLLHRLKENLSDHRTHRIVFIITHADAGEPPFRALDPVRVLAEDLGFRSEFHSVASFSTSQTVEPGTGVSELVAATLKDDLEGQPSFWPPRPRGGTREVLRFRSVEEQV